jgi:hypothetical protein
MPVGTDHTFAKTYARELKLESRRWKAGETHEKRIVSPGPGPEAYPTRAGAVTQTSAARIVTIEATKLKNRIKSIVNVFILAPNG